MLSIARCRFLLGTDCKLTDVELEQLRHELYALSDVAVTTFCAQNNLGCRNGSGTGKAPGNFTLIPASERQALDERAAILEYEAGLKKPEAERQAFGEWVQSKRSMQETQTRARRKKKRPLT